MAVEPKTTPALLGHSMPSAKEKKYDRQLRLWAAAGQEALESARVLLVNSGAGTVGIETLKNLVLPGIGYYSIFDPARVNEADLGVNFFLDKDGLGSSRAKQCANFLQELNPHVESDWFPKTEGEHLEELLDSSPKFSIVIYACPLELVDVALLEGYTQQNSIPLVSLHSCGFYSYFRLGLLNNFPVVDTHAESNVASDMRLLQPWKELLNFTKTATQDLEQMDDHAHGHVPYLCLLIHYLQAWKKSHGAYPSTYKEKVAFRTMLSAEARCNNAEGGEENFDEAVGAVLKSLHPPTVSTEIRDIFDYEPSVEESAAEFWLIVNAIKAFYARHGVLPLSGALPDMKAVSKTYVELQSIYKAKAKSDAAEVYGDIQAQSDQGKITLAHVESFCRNASSLKLIYGLRSVPVNLADLTRREMKNDELIAVTLAPQSLLPIYLALRGTSHAVSLKTVPQILEAVHQIAPELAGIRLTNVAEEIARAAGGELHNISALTGGMAAQEIIKIITRQYIPMDNTCVFDGISSRIQVLRT